MCYLSFAVILPLTIRLLCSNFPLPFLLRQFFSLYLLVHTTFLSALLFSLVLPQKRNLVNKTCGNLEWLGKTIDIKHIRCTVIRAIFNRRKDLEAVDISKDGFESHRDCNGGHDCAWICSRKNDLFT